MMKTTQAFLAATLSAAIVPFAAGISEAATIAVIDPLTDVQTASLFSGTTTSGVTGSVLGSVTRSLSVTTTNGAPNQIDAQIPPFGQTNGFSYSSGDGRDGTATINYGTFSAVDLTQGGLADSIAIGSTSSDLPDGTIALTINGTTQTLVLPSGIPPSPTTVLSFSLASFPGATAATSLSFFLDPVTAQDVSFNFIELQAPMNGTPEPASILGLLAVGGAFALKNKKRA